MKTTGSSGINNLGRRRNSLRFISCPRKLAQVRTAIAVADPASIFRAWLFTRCAYVSAARFFFYGIRGEIFQNPVSRTQAGSEHWILLQLQGHTAGFDDWGTPSFIRFISRAYYASAQDGKCQVRLCILIQLRTGKLHDWLPDWSLSAVPVARLLLLPSRIFIFR